VWTLLQVGCEQPIWLALGIGNNWGQTLRSISVHFEHYKINGLLLMGKSLKTWISRWLWVQVSWHQRPGGLLTSKDIQSFQKIRLRVLCLTILTLSLTAMALTGHYTVEYCEPRGTMAEVKAWHIQTCVPSTQWHPPQWCTSYVGDRHTYNYLPTGQGCTLTYLFPAIIHLVPREGLEP
jgi:hypothetical protein